jgi:hemoglobin/transferrin/lactoferrin receptor protein
LGGAIERHRRRAERAADAQLSIVRGLVVLGYTAAALLFSVAASAQSTLPAVTVEASKTKAKASKAKTPAQAAEAPATAETAQERDKARSEAVYATPGAVSTAGRSDVETFGLIDTGDILRAMPGVSTRESPQNAGVAVNIRGLEGSGRVSMMIDGVRQNFRFTGHEAQGFVYVDPALIAGLDVVRGAVSTVGGAGALVGSANLRTLDVEDIMKPGQQKGVLGLVTYGTNGVGWSEMLAAGATNGSVGVAGAISHHEPNSYENGDGITVPYTDRDLLSGLFKINFRLSPEQTLKLGAVLYDSDFFANSYFQNVTSNTYTLKYAYKPLDNPLIDLAFNAHASQLGVEYFGNAAGGGSAKGRVMSDDGLGFDVTNTSRFGLGGIRVAATYGYEYFSDDVDASNKLTPSAGGGVNPSGEAWVGGAFSQTTFSYGMYDLIAGLRYDTYHIDGKFDADGAGPGTTLTPLDRTDGRLSPKLTLAAQVLPWLQPYLTYSESFRPPSIGETMLDGTHPTPGVAFLPNPNLDPEIQKGWELGANVKKDGLLTHGDAFRFKAAYFDMGIDNYVTGCAVGFDPTIPPFGAALIQFCNTPGTSDVRGVELEGKYDAGHLFAGLSYTYTHTDLPSQQDGVGAASFLPEHVLVATGGLRFLQQKLVVGGRISYFSESNVGGINVGPITQGGAYASQYMPGYTLVDLFTSYTFDSGLQIGATVSNLFDVNYTPALTTPILPQGPVTPTTCFGSNFAGCSDSGMGRTVMFTAKMQF